MSRHRNVRSMNYADEYYDEDEDYSCSFDDNYCISPGTVAQFTFNRDKDMNLAKYMGGEETEEGEDQASSLHEASSTGNLKKLSDLDRAKLNSCLEELKNILGETTSDNIMTECILRHEFNTEASLNELLNQTDAPKPQRQPRERRNRSQGDEYDILELSKQTKSHVSVSLPKNQIIIPPLNNNTLKMKTGTPPQKSIDSLSQFLSKMSTQNNKIASDSKQSENLGLKAIKNIPAHQILGSSLSDLASQHQSSGPSLSRLANQNETDISLAELANQDQKSNQSQSFGMSLADLAKQHKKCGNSTNQNTISGVSQTDLANQNQLFRKDYRMSNQNHNSGSSLADLAKQDQGSRADFFCNIPSNSNQKNVSGFSLAELANQHQSGQNKVSGLSLAGLANQNQSNQISSNENVSTNVSLSDLANQHKNIAPVTNQNIGNSSGTKLSLAEMAASHQKHVQSGITSRHIPNIGNGLSDMALGKPDISLCNLNKSNSSVNTPNMVTRFSLAEMAHQNSSDIECDGPTDQLEINSDIGENSEQTISLASLTIKKPSKLKKESSAKKSKLVDRQPSETYFEDTDLNDSEIFIEKSPSFSLDQSLIKSASSLGKVLSMKYKVRCSDRSPYWKIFQYSNQVKTAILKPDVKLHIVKQFDFSTPSPDDIVKQRQKAAFT